MPIAWQRSNSCNYRMEGNFPDCEAGYRIVVFEALPEPHWQTYLPYPGKVKQPVW